ncbi:L-threonylcarbamoyladenylate synthase [Halanaerobacter jeridensis]|uniref:Threonylcarbamoyl-AMP synthase n=1 Tax=Halanaerobacter jeridensis TaxID=706427 RepID=A0A938XSJ3_9FIRM|nr:L-threonylcarbamoyladenylate synthase [Halanaerobacter jeridensis]MBM7557024.1 L-threonylcarbamoyladenylate synthase [Halanaerobacter jeridensis]
MREKNGTKIFSKTELKEAADLLQKGKLVAFPTETVYGLGANALDGEAVQSIFAAKGRPADNPLIVHIARQEEIKELTTGNLSPQAQKLIKRFWPGPLTLVLKKSEEVPEITTGGLDTVAVRMPKHSLALKLIELAEVPLAAPSANLSGRPSPTLAEHVIADLAGEIAAVVDGGQTGIGVESTVVDLSTEVPTLLRPGGITYEMLEEVLGTVEIDPAVKAKVNQESKEAISPGMKYRHYAPQAEVILVEGEAEAITDKIQELAAQESNVGIMASREYQDFYQQGIVKVMGSRDDLTEISNNIFKLLREFDKLGVDKILIEGLPEHGLGLAIMNRLRKSAGYQIIDT